MRERLGLTLEPVEVAPLRTGAYSVWRPEEVACVERVIEDFKSGLLDAPKGIGVLRFLAGMLHRSPGSVLGKFPREVFGLLDYQPAVRVPSNAAAIDKAKVQHLGEGTALDSSCFSSHTH
jgi:hypothetical protein